MDEDDLKKSQCPLSRKISVKWSSWLRNTDAEYSWKIQLKIWWRKKISVDTFQKICVKWSSHLRNADSEYRREILLKNTIEKYDREKQLRGELVWILSRKISVKWTSPLIASLETNYGEYKKISDGCSTVVLQICMIRWMGLGGMVPGWGGEQGTLRCY